MENVVVKFYHGQSQHYTYNDKANLRDLITGLVILLKLDSNRRFSACVTLKFDGWPSKTIGHLSSATSSFVQHFIAIGEFKLELQSRNVQSGSKWTIFFSRVTLKFDGWPSKTIGHLLYATSCAAFRSRWWIQTGVTVRKRPIWVKIADFF